MHGYSYLWRIEILSNEPFCICTRQETATQKQSMSKAKESEYKLKMELQAVKSPLEMETEELSKQMMQLVKMQPSVTGMLKEVHAVIIIACIVSLHVCDCVSSHVS